MGKHNRRKKNQLKQGNITPLKQAKTLNVLSSPPNINTNTRILYIIIVIIKKKSANRQVIGVIRTVLSIFASFVFPPHHRRETLLTDPASLTTWAHKVSFLGKIVQFSYYVCVTPQTKTEDLATLFFKCQLSNRYTAMKVYSDFE